MIGLLAGTIPALTNSMANLFVLVAYKLNTMTKVYQFCDIYLEAEHKLIIEKLNRDSRISDIRVINGYQSLDKAKEDKVKFSSFDINII